LLQKKDRYAFPGKGEKKNKCLGKAGRRGWYVLYWQMGGGKGITRHLREEWIKAGTEAKGGSFIGIKSPLKLGVRLSMEKARISAKGGRSVTSRRGFKKKKKIDAVHCSKNSRRKKKTRIFRTVGDNEGEMGRGAPNADDTGGRSHKTRRARTKPRENAKTKKRKNRLFCLDQRVDLKSHSSGKKLKQTSEARGEETRRRLSKRVNLRSQGRTCGEKTS